MKKTILMAFLVLGAVQARSQDIATGIMGTVSGTALITTYFVKTNVDTKNAVRWNEVRGTTYSETSLKKSYQKENLPFLVVGVGCGVMAVAGFTGAVTIFKGKNGKVTSVIGGNGITVSYNFIR